VYIVGKILSFAALALASTTISQPAHAVYQAQFGLPTVVTGTAGSTVEINAIIRNSGDQAINFDTQLAGLSLDRVVPGEPAFEAFETIDSFQFFASGIDNPFFGVVLLPGQDFNFVFGRALLPSLGIGSASTSGAAISFVFDGNFSAPSYAFRPFQVTIGGAASQGPFRFSSTSGVPEAGTWSLLILGFGAVGASLRTKRRANRESVRSV
jgi:hypothetical protein